MNEMILEQVELLVTRQLDGRITADEQVELEEILAADPAAQRLAEHLRGDHRSLCAALQTMFPRPVIPVETVSPVMQLRWGHRFRPITALAAALAMMGGLGLAHWYDQTSSSTPTRVAQVPPETMIQPRPNAGTTLHTAGAPIPRGSAEFTHDTGTPAGWVRDGSSYPRRKQVICVEVGDSILLLEVPVPIPPQEIY